MKNKIILFIPLVLILVSSSAQSIDSLKNEDFMPFIYQFSTDSAFQFSRIKFPLIVIEFDFDSYEFIESKINIDNWEFRYFFFTNDKRSQIYDNFDLKLDDSNERVFAWHGVETGLNIYYYFRRINGKWYLVKFLNAST